jgi:hypothetical protein
MTSVRREGELEQLLRPDGRKGMTVPRHEYEKIRTFILSFLDTDHGKTINELLEEGQRTFAGTILVQQVAWLVLQVKLDLEARGFVRVFIPEYSRRINFMKITRLGQKFIRQEKALAGMNS